MQLFDKTFTDTLEDGQRIARTSWSGEKWLVWPIDINSPIAIRQLTLATEGDAVFWEMSDFYADTEADDWEVVE